MALAPSISIMMVAAPLIVRPATSILDDPLFRVGLTSWAMCAVTYALSRSPWPRFGLWLLPWGSLIPTWQLVLTSAGTPWAEGVLTLPAVAPMVAGFLLAAPVALSLLAVNVALTLAYLSSLDPASRPPGDEIGLILQILVAPTFILIGRILRQQRAALVDSATALTRSRDQTLAILDAAPQAMLAVLTNGDIAFANRPAHNLFGYAEGTLVGRSVEDLVPLEWREEHPRKRFAYAKDPKPRLMGANRDLLGLRQDGTRVPIEVGLNAFDGPQGKLVLASVLDLTSRHKAARLAEETLLLEAERKRFEELSKFRATMMNTVAHDLKNPLTPISLELAVIKTVGEGALPPAGLRATEVLERNVRRLVEQIDNMLDASRLESGTMQLRRGPADLQSLVKETFESFREAASQAQVTLTCEAPDPLPVNVDAGRIVQVLHNLVSNAIKYTPIGGQVAISSLREDGKARVQVRDTGLGFSEEQRAKLFQPFGRIHAPIRKGATTTGLGLYIAKGMVEAHGGDLKVSSTGPGNGSTFEIWMPLAGAPPT